MRYIDVALAFSLYFSTAFAIPVVLKLKGTHPSNEPAPAPAPVSDSPVFNSPGGLSWANAVKNGNGNVQHGQVIGSSASNSGSQAALGSTSEKPKTGTDNKTDKGKAANQQSAAANPGPDSDSQQNAATRLPTSEIKVGQILNAKFILPRKCMHDLKPQIGTKFAIDAQRIQKRLRVRKRVVVLANKGDHLLCAYALSVTAPEYGWLAKVVTNVKYWYPVLPASNGDYAPLPEEEFNKARTRDKTYTWYNLERIVMLTNSEEENIKLIDEPPYSQKAVDTLKKAIDEKTGNVLSHFSVCVASTYALWSSFAEELRMSLMTLRSANKPGYVRV
ncbi:hypothetical protein CVT24_009160 [Panaeolus cyanescens]|uniref:Uncharacterized protein n=1 Tax=Panaeolus cyanescens TaxID=181874 RepID=A0A409Y8E9_9AGAR|nr:hypothetical protein CVT24_009160 [Panaeolus cyanescens]